MAVKALRRLPVTKDPDEIFEFINRELVPFLNEVSIALSLGPIRVTRHQDFGVKNSTGGIRLKDRAIYNVEADVTMPDGCFLIPGQDNVIQGQGRDRDFVRFNVATPSIDIQGTIGSIRLDRIRIVNTGTGGGVVSGASAMGRFVLENTEVNLNGGPAVSVGSSDVLIRTARFLEFSTGVTMLSDGITCIIDGCRIVQGDGGSGNGCIDLGSTRWVTVRIDHIGAVTDAGGFCLKGAANNGNMLFASSEGFIENCRFDGAGGVLDQITIDDLQWVSFANRNLEDSLTIGGYYFNGNATPTTVSDSVSYFPVLGTTLPLEERRMEMTADNEMTITSLNPGSAVVTMTASASKSGATVNYGFAIFRERDAVLTQIIPTMFVEIKNTIVPIPLTVQGRLETGDKVSVRVINPTNTNSLTVDTLIVTIKE